ncbi:hypothetical protein [Streptosporangium sp. NPDC051022]|uniref:hypothetical protein n=1 Tax=Streptosporangium sp. NPDC051022 TaxID=3155752 RepID=UPI00341350AE
MIAPMRRAVQRAGFCLVLCLAVLAHLVLSAAHAQAAHHHHGVGLWPGTSIAAGPLAGRQAGPRQERVPQRCPVPTPPEHDHRLCGAATAPPGTEARPLSPPGPLTGLSATTTSSSAASAQTTHHVQPARALPGTTVLISKSVCRI